MSDQPEFRPPDPRQQVIQDASLKYQRAAQVAADAIYMVYSRLAQRPVLHEAAIAVAAAVAPVITEEILNDADIMDPQPYRVAQNPLPQLP